MAKTRLLALPAVMIVVGLIGLCLTTAGTYTIDTGQLVGGIAKLDSCLDAGVLTKCGLHEDRYYCSKPYVCGRAEHYSDIGPFPVLQYLPAWALTHAGASPRGVVRGLVAISGLAALLLLVLAIRATAQAAGPRSAALIAACLLASPLLWYSHSGFGEGLAAAILGLLAIAAMRAWHPALVGLLAFGAIVTKDASLPFVVAIVLIAWWSAGRRPGRAEVAAVVVGMIAGLVLITAFNLFRFGSPFNLFYGASVLHTPLADRPERFVALLFAPNGGLLWFWPAAALVVAASLTIAVQRSGWSRRLLREPAVLVLILLVALLAGFASWFSSFGASAWGPRLLLPWVVPLLLILVAAYGRELTELAARRRTATIVAWSLIAVLSLAQLGVVFNSGRQRHEYPVGHSIPEIAYRVGRPDKTCPYLAIIQVSQKDYFRCSRHDAWDRPYVLATAVKDAGRHELGAAILYLLALAGLVALVQARWLNHSPVTRSRKTTTQRPVSSTSST